MSYLSDAEIEQTYELESEPILHFQVGSIISGHVELNFKNETIAGYSSISDNFIIYDSGKITFDHWYPEQLYLKLEYLIYLKLYCRLHP